MIEPEDIPELYDVDRQPIQELPPLFEVLEWLERQACPNRHLHDILIYWPKCGYTV